MNDDLTFRSAGLSHVGRVREHNEDAWLAVPRSASGRSPTAWAGTRAASLPAAMVTALGRLPADRDAPGLLRAVQAALAAAHPELHALGAATGDLCAAPWRSCSPSMATSPASGPATAASTACAPAVSNRLTRDHSLVQELIDQGRARPGRGRSHPWRNRITRAVGIAEPARARPGRRAARGPAICSCCAAMG